MERFYAQGMTAGDVAEALASFDIEADAIAVRQFMVQHGYDAIGVRRDGLVAGYARVGALTGGSLGDHIESIGPGHALPSSAPLYVLIPLLDETRSIFVTTLGHIGGIVTRADINKPPVRMWLFGVITMLEMAFNRLLATRFPDGAWMEYLTAARLKKAEELQAVRARSGHRTDVLNCLQFSDKGSILFKLPEIREMFDIPSRKRATEMVTNARRLRDNLAHSGNIVAENWDIVVRLCGVVGMFPKLIAME